MIKNNIEHYKALIREQNTYLTNYTDFRIGGVSEAMLNIDVSRKTMQDNILMSSFIVVMHPTLYTDSKGIWMIKSTEEDLHKVLQDVETSLSVLPSVVPDKYFNTYSAFPAPHVIPQYGNSYKYTAKIMSSVSNDMNNDEKSYVAPPRNAWNRGPPKTVWESTQSRNTNTSNVKSNSKKQSQMSSEQVIEIKQSFEQYQKNNKEILTNINNKLKTKMNDSRTMIKELVKDILQAELKEILLDIVSTILQQIKSSTDKLLRIVKNVSVQTKATIMDKMRVLTATTQGASTESLSESDEMLVYQLEDDDN
eukprot:7733641-Ditylum_brightwellii.AAC.1